MDDLFRAAELVIGVILVPFLSWVATSVVSMREDLQKVRVEVRELLDEFRKEIYAQEKRR